MNPGIFPFIFILLSISGFLTSRLIPGISPFILVFIFPFPIFISGIFNSGFEIVISPFGKLILKLLSALIYPDKLWSSISHKGGYITFNWISSSISLLQICFNVSDNLSSFSFSLFVESNSIPLKFEFKSGFLISIFISFVGGFILIFGSFIFKLGILLLKSGFILFSILGLLTFPFIDKLGRLMFGLFILKLPLGKLKRRFSSIKSDEL